MNKIKEFTDLERATYSQTYVHLIMQTEELSTFLSSEEVNKRYFSRKVHLIKDYLDKLDEADRLADGTGLFEFFKNDDRYKEDVLQFKGQIIDELTKLKLCEQCKCSTCVHECSFKSCHYCQTTCNVKGCDHSRYYITSGHKDVILYSNDENRDVAFSVIGLLTDDFANKHYIYLVETSNKNNQHILEYHKYVNGKIDYLPLDEELLDKIYNVFVGFDIYA